MIKFRLLNIGNYHPTGLIEEIDHSNHWGSEPIRTNYPGSSHAEVVDILLRGPCLDEPRDLHQLYNEIHCQDYDIYDQFPVTRQFVNHLRDYTASKEIGRVILTRLAPNGVIYPHIDEGEVPRYYKRYHYCVHGGDNNLFIVENITQSIQSKVLFEVDVTRKHAVVNMMDTDRVHLIMDMR